ncbi:unnamed protein product [Paramecium sonneborni]|uniref:UBR-type domain-containing protein n=1 Tax=Paramecium sonneborni TaxID=65129 RepID=A0A8S1KWJ5_9CILI|nr:unnamed protein product [Paramecium sonneborni]
MKALIDKIDTKCNQHDKELQIKDIITAFISNQLSHLNFIENAKIPQFQCQNTFEQGQLVFQCLTCSKNLNHLICLDCFDFSKHIGHQYIPTTMCGFCDCGNSEMFKHSLCTTHSQQIQYQENINLQVPQDLCQNLELFMKAVATLFEQYSQKISQQKDSFPTTILMLYFFSLNQNIPNLQKFIESKCKIAAYFHLLSKTKFLLELFYLALDSIINNSPSLQNVVSYLFQLPLQQNSQSSILESILQSYGLVEPILCIIELPYDLSNLFQQIFKNQFKQIMTSLCFRKFQSFISYNKIIVTPNSDIIKTSIVQLENLMEYTNGTQRFDGIVQGLMKQTEMYFQALQTSKLINIGFNGCEIIRWLSTFQDKQILNEFVFGGNTFELFKIIQKQFQYLHKPNEQWIFCPSQPLEFIDTQFQQEDIGDLCMIQIQQILGNDFNNFLNHKVDKKILKNFQMNDLIITTLINSVSEAIPAVYDTYKGDYTYRVINKEDLMSYIKYQGYALQVINLAIQDLFQSKLSQKQFQMNFIDLLIVKCYNFIKLKRNIFAPLDFEIKKFYHQILNKQNQTNDQKTFLLKTMFVHLFKNASLLDKMFITFLYVHFCQKDYKTPADFRQYLSDLLEDSIETIKNCFQRILGRCIQTFTTVFYTEDQEVIDTYYGLDENSIKFKSESIDTAFGKLYLFLFDSIGLTDIYQEFQIVSIPSMTQTCELTYQYFMRIMTSDLDVFNLCISYFHKNENLPKILQQTLEKTIQNILGTQSHYLYSTIQNKLKDMGIEITTHLQNHVLKICSLDSSINKLTLKKQYKQIYDPGLFFLDQQFQTVQLEKLSNKLMTQRVLIFGNGLEWDIKQFNQTDYHSQRKCVLQVMCSIPSIFQSFHLINQGFIKTEIFIQFIYYQILCANYFYNNELQAQTQNIINQLCNLMRNPQIQKFQIHFELIILLLQKQSFQGDIPNLSLYCISKQKAKASKSQFKCKYDKLQSSKFLVNLMKQNFLNDKTLQQCDLCKLQLDENKVIPMFFTNRVSAKNYSIVPNLIKQTENSFIYYPTISIEICDHKFHARCFEQSIKEMLMKTPPELPEWQKYVCPICLKCFNLQIPMNDDINALQLQSFNQSLLFVVKQLNQKQDIFQQYQENEFNALVEIYLQILINLIQNLFINIEEFQLLEKHLILKQIINFLSLIVENYKICGLTNGINYHFKSNNTIFNNILDAIDKNIIKVQNQNQLKEEIYQIAKNFYHNYQQQMTILCYCFAISQNLQEDFNKNKDLQQLQLKDEFAEYYLIMKSQLKKKIINILGENFQLFHDKYFPQLCHYCKSYNQQFSESNDILVCVLCSKVFCLRNCTESQYGNINMHALEEHYSSSIYVSLINGKLTQVQVPHCHYGQQILYYHKQIGNPIRYDNYNLFNQNWKDYLIDQNKVGEIADYIINNSYQSRFSLQQTDKDHFHFRGEL